MVYEESAQPPAPPISSRSAMFDELCDSKTDPFLNDTNMHFCATARSGELFDCAKRIMNDQSLTGNDLTRRLAKPDRFEAMLADVKAMLGGDNSFVDAAVEAGASELGVRSLMAGLASVMSDERDSSLHGRLVRGKAHATAATYTALATNGACAVPSVLDKLRAKMPNP